MPVLYLRKIHHTRSHHAISWQMPVLNQVEKNIVNIPYQTPTCHLLTGASPKPNWEEHTIPDPTMPSLDRCQFSTYLRRTYHTKPQYVISWQVPVLNLIEKNIHHIRSLHTISWQLTVLNHIEKNIPYQTPTCHLLTSASPQPNWEEHTIPVPNMSSLEQDRCQPST